MSSDMSARRHLSSSQLRLTFWNIRHPRCVPDYGSLISDHLYPVLTLLVVDSETGLPKDFILALPVPRLETLELRGLGKPWTVPPSVVPTFIGNRAPKVRSLFVCDFDIAWESLPVASASLTSLHLELPTISSPPLDGPNLPLLNYLAVVPNLRTWSLEYCLPAPITGAVHRTPDSIVKLPNVHSMALPKLRIHIDFQRADDIVSTDSDLLSTVHLSTGVAAPHIRAMKMEDMALAWRGPAVIDSTVKVSGYTATLDGVATVEAVKRMFSLSRLKALSLQVSRSGGRWEMREDGWRDLFDGSPLVRHMEIRSSLASYDDGDGESEFGTFLRALTVNNEADGGGLLFPALESMGITFDGGERCHLGQKVIGELQAIFLFALRSRRDAGVGLKILSLESREIGRHP
ncbi:hypothetical protein BV25DRAFT_1918251 [Artomyces pyxidatus]|uniref:Uncharacterized protein n=1 Tax=Artomyces pyxidatus TaxID=48021 RepID=A0ACB8SW45_9AGAM|nr:hypothetical protein BV25DRAFT_1918251 [Artomyces pyxidatus]